ncbi:hypothetical protein PENSPDRAFT_289336 [Peniophora sp. CONT]|nr:hypothetical protein PENSPDRAFT_289336 [Peniophora sp. CONT]
MCEDACWKSTSLVLLGSICATDPPAPLIINCRGAEQPSHEADIGSRALLRQASIRAPLSRPVHGWRLAGTGYVVSMYTRASAPSSIASLTFTTDTYLALFHTNPFCLSRISWPAYPAAFTSGKKLYMTSAR